MLPAMDASPAPLFRFASAAAEEPAPRPAAWKAPLAACGAGLAGTAALIWAVTPAAEAPARVAPAPSGVAAAFAPAAAGAGDDEPVMPALHVWDGRPVRATPQDTLPEDAPAAAALWTGAVAAATAGPGTPPAATGSPVRTASAGDIPAAGSRVAPAVWLTGEIRP